MNTQRPWRNNFDPTMPLNIEFCLRVRIDLKHNSVASVLLLSSSRQRGFLKKTKTQNKPWDVDSRAEGKEEAVWGQLSICRSCGSSAGHFSRVGRTFWKKARQSCGAKVGVLLVWTALEIEECWWAGDCDNTSQEPRCEAQRYCFWAAVTLLSGKLKINENCKIGQFMQGT